MKVLVTYHSDTGNTEKLAQAIYEGVEQADKDIQPIKDVEDLGAYDLIFVGFPVHSHSVPAKVEAFIKALPQGKKLAFFATHGSLRGGHLAITALYYAISLASEEKVLGTFGCRGKVKQKIIDALMEKAEHRAWAIEAQGAAGHPDDADLEDAKQFAQWMVTKARSM
jgi:flavodoxin